jgi:hypothetical protein
MKFVVPPKVCQNQPKSIASSPASRLSFHLRNGGCFRAGVSADLIAIRDTAPLQPTHWLLSYRDIELVRRWSNSVGVNRDHATFASRCTRQFAGFID